MSNKDEIELENLEIEIQRRILKINEIAKEYAKQERALLKEIKNLQKQKQDILQIKLF